MKFRPFPAGRRDAVAAGPAILALVLLLALAPVAYGAGSVKVANAWVRAPVAGQKVASAYVELTSPGNAALVAAGSAVAGRVEMHSMAMEGGVMRMRAVPRIELPAGQTVKLAPGGLHLMLFDLKQPIKPGDKVALTLSVQPSGATAGMSLTTLELQAEVRPAAAGAHTH